MDSISPSIVYPLQSVLTNKQQNCIAELNSAVSKTEIKRIAINEPFPVPTDKMAAVDVEHDESGGFVGCGLYSGTGIAYYYTSLVSLHSVCFPALNLIAHNGVSDIEILDEWGINVSYKQLVHDVYLIGHIMDSSLKSFGLKDMAKREIGVSYPSYDDIVGKRGLKTERITLDKQPLELVSAYNSLDTYCTWKLYERQKKSCENL